MLDSKEKISDFLKLSVLCFFQNFKNSYSMESLSEYIKSLIGTEGENLTERTMFDYEYSDKINGVYDLTCLLMNMKGIWPEE